MFKQQRNSKMYLNEVYFWTSTIYQWKHLLKPDKFKQVITDSISYLTEKEKIKVYGFVLMPNHIHILWEMIELNGKEMPYASFQKQTAHAFKNDLRQNHPQVLNCFKVDENERTYRFWQRDALAIHILSREMAEQKLNYMHYNPLQERWNLCQDPVDYHYSSSSYYIGKRSAFSFISDYRDRL